MKAKNCLPRALAFRAGVLALGLTIASLAQAHDGHMVQNFVADLAHFLSNTEHLLTIAAVCFLAGLFALCLFGIAKKWLNKQSARYPESSVSDDGRPQVF